MGFLVIFTFYIQTVYLLPRIYTFTTKPVLNVLLTTSHVCNSCWKDSISWSITLNVHSRIRHIKRTNSYTSIYRDLYERRRVMNISKRWNYTFWKLLLIFLLRFNLIHFLSLFLVRFLIFQMIHYSFVTLLHQY